VDILARFPATPLPIQCIRKVLRPFPFFHILLHYSLILIFIQSFFPSSIYTQYLWDSVFYIIAIIIHMIKYDLMLAVWSICILCTWASSWDYCLLHLLPCLCVWQELSNMVWHACCKTVDNSPADALSLCLYVTILSTCCDLLYLTELWLIRYREGWSSRGLTEMEKYWTTQ
jgi:hypothetical protein